MQTGDDAYSSDENMPSGAALIKSQVTHAVVQRVG
jgi:hypothetical protein